MMKIAIRADSAELIGSGHIMRCLTLAENLRECGAEVVFVCRDLPGNIISVIENKQFYVNKLSITRLINCTSVDEFVDNIVKDKEKDLELTCNFLKENGPFDWVVVDHYSLDRLWEQGIRQLCKRIWVIDDLANRKHDCDALLDQNYHLDKEKRYIDLVPTHCKMLLGPQYLLLRHEFLSQKKYRLRDGSVKRVLVFFGGTDPTNETIKTINAIELLNRSDIHFDVVVGSGNKYKSEVEGKCNRYPNLHYHCQINYMAKLMMLADLSIGAGGTTTWERCYLGLPSLVISLAENQRQGIEEIASTGAFLYLGASDEVTSQDICNSIQWALENPKLLRDVGRNAEKFVGADKGTITNGWIREFWG